jgi:putative peptide zinc metalloprotease protein
MLAMMDGRRTLGEIWDELCSELAEDAPTQDELLALTTQLNQLDLLVTQGTPDAEHFSNRGAAVRRKSRLARFLNPLAIRVPIFDPDALLNELWPLARPFFTLWGALAYLLLIGAGAATAARNWDALTGNLIDRVLSTQSLLILLIVYPIVKAVHELGHGLAVKRWGGEVREVGVMMLVFVPVPYVDASAASAFTSKWQRALVGAMGIIVELGLAAAAVLLWTEIEEGLLRAALFNVILIGGVSTLLFNGNPLLRFDGYYVLADLIEIPNLGARGTRYLGYLLQRYLFGIETARSPVRAPGERTWFFFYSIAAFIYRLFISFVIITLVATRFFVIGLLLAIWAMTLMFGMPIYRHLKFLSASPALRGRRGRAWLVAGGCAAVILGAVSFVPVPYRIVAEGIIAAPDHATVYADSAGIVDDVLVPPGTAIESGTAIVKMSDPFITAQLSAARAEARKYALRHQQALNSGAYEVRIWSAQAARAASEVALIEEKISGLTIVSQRAGKLVMPRVDDLPGRFLNRGDVVGYIVVPSELVVRTAISQNDAHLVRERTRDVQLRSVERPNVGSPGHIVREVPMVGGALASMALTTEGGGIFSHDPRETRGPKTFESVMHFDIRPEGPAPSSALGSRVYLRFDFGSEPLIFRVWRSTRQLFLSRFNV